MTEIYNFISHLKGAKLLILPAAIAKPKGRENKRVNRNISIEVTIPPSNCSITVDNIIL
jgi:predicted amidohydrolase